MSVNRPLSGWNAAFEIRYDVASQERREKELKDEEMGAVKVATMVVSGGINFQSGPYGRGHTQGGQKDTQPYTAHNHYDFPHVELFVSVLSMFVASLRPWSIVALKERCLLGCRESSSILCRIPIL